MPCLKPIDVPKRGFVDLKLTVACGQCIGCRVDRVRDWGTRAVHESKLWPYSCTITLTYDDEHLPEHGSLRPRDWQLFIKRLRNSRPGQTIRYIQAGEYGEGTALDPLGRPHHHAILYNAEFPDRRPIAGSAAEGKPRWTSQELVRLWGNGPRCDIGVLNSTTARYCVGYILKKITGDRAESHYRIVDPSTGEVFQRVPEYSTRSLKPGIGAGFIERFMSDIYPDDFCATANGKQQPVPPYYDKLLQREDPELLEAIKARRRAFAMQPEQRANSTPARMESREHCVKARLALRKGKL